MFPCLVQCNDWRFHVAIDAGTLLVCPNVETAYWVWRTLRRRCSLVRTPLEEREDNSSEGGRVRKRREEKEMLESMA